jgi:cysteinyl-tRNA synthetase
MAIRIYNTLGGTKEIFVPLTPNRVKMYVCGPTVYDASHIGHARSAVVFDVVVRYFNACGYAVTYVRNFTDVDDKIINRARQEEVPPLDLAERYISEYHEDMDALNVLRPTFEPRATEYVERMVRFIEGLLDKGIAYSLDGDVYYAVERFGEYGKLSGRSLDDMEAGARVEVDGRKRNPFDFALWKAAKPGEPYWESPWGSGRPGWHIECSAMSCELLGETFDIHGGGKDLIFPHHENEIAQSEGAFGKPFARYWMHNGFVNIDQEKMSKSLGNFLMIRDLLKTAHPEALRLFLLSNHYRSPIDFTPKAISDAGTALDKVYALLGRLETVAPAGSSAEATAGEAWGQFRQAMDDDFNTAQGIGVLFETVRRLNRLLDAHPRRLPRKTAETVERGRADLMRMGRVLGVLHSRPEAYFESKRAQGAASKALDVEAVAALVERRSAARKQKEWALADKIRKELEAMNVILEDRPEGTTWRVVE